MPPEPELPVAADTKTADGINESQLHRVEDENVTGVQTDPEASSHDVEDTDQSNDEREKFCWGRYGRIILWIGFVCCYPGPSFSN
jgi:hypothetical protein